MSADHWQDFVRRNAIERAQRDKAARDDADAQPSPFEGGSALEFGDGFDLEGHYRRRLRPTYSVVDEALPTATFARGFAENLAAFVEQLPKAARRQLRDETIRDALREPLAGIFYSSHASTAAQFVAACAETIERDREHAAALIEAELLRFGATLDDDYGLHPCATYAAIELVRRLDDEDPVSIAFCLKRYAQLLASIPGAKSGAAMGGRASSAGVLAQTSAVGPRSDDAIIAEVSRRVADACRAAGCFGWADLANFVGEVDCYLGVIPDRKRTNAATVLAEHPRDILGLIDLTTLGSAKCCLCFFRDHVAFRNWWASASPGVHRLPYARLHDAVATSSDIEVAKTELSMSGTILSRERVARTLRALSTRDVIDDARRAP